MDVDEAIEFVRDQHHAVLATTRRDGSTQLSPVVAGVNHAGRIVISSRETAMKTKNIRRSPRGSLCVFTDRFFGEWVQVDGEFEVVSLPDAMDGLIDYYREMSGEHADWEQYRAAMVSEQRVLLLLNATRAGPNQSG